MGLFELVLFACLMACSAMPLDPRATTASAPSIDTNLYEFNSDELTNNIVGEIISAVCGLDSGKGDEGVIRDKVTQVFCNALDEKEDFVSRPEPDLSTSEPTNQVIFVEVPVRTRRVRVPPPPQVTVYVLPPEENHVYRVFDMRGRREGVSSVRFLSGGGGLRGI